MCKGNRSLKIIIITLVDLNKCFKQIKLLISLQQRRANPFLSYHRIYKYHGDPSSCFFFPLRIRLCTSDDSHSSSKPVFKHIYVTHRIPGPTLPRTVEPRQLELNSDFGGFFKSNLAYFKSKYKKGQKIIFKLDKVKNNLCNKPVTYFFASSH